jgi:hypothetical protein
MKNPILMLCAWMAIGCKPTSSLLLPLKNATVDRHIEEKRKNHNSNDILFITEKDSVVKAMESAVVVSTFLVDNEQTAVLSGRFTIIYGSMRVLNVAKGDTVSAGDPIGILIYKESERGLEIHVKDPSGKSLSVDQLPWKRNLRRKILNSASARSS